MSDELAELEERISRSIDRLRHHFQGQVTDAERHLQKQIREIEGRIAAEQASDTTTIEWATKDRVNGVAGEVREVKAKVAVHETKIGELTLGRRAWTLVGKGAVGLISLVGAVLGVLLALQKLGWL